jgi:hypothetical protein
MRTDSPTAKHTRTIDPSRPRTPVKRLMIGSWAAGAALVFLVFLIIGVDERTALPLVAILAAALSAELVTGTVCVLKGYHAVGMVALVAWLAFPIGSAISTEMFPESWEPALLGSALGTGVILVVSALAAITAARPARWGSRWARSGWNRWGDLPH